MDKVKLGIIGMGRMGITHYSIINSYKSVDIVAVADASNLILDVLKKYIPQLGVYKDYKELIDVEKPDAIIVCTPPVSHFEICEYACEKGIHVFCEKPFTVSPVDAQKLSEAFEAKGLINQVGYVNRFNDAFTFTRKLVKENVIGDIIRFRSEMFSCTISKKEEGEGWRNKRENGGGVTYEMASHAIDLVNYLIGTVGSVQGTVMTQVYSKVVEDIVSSTLRCSNDVYGTLYVNWCDKSYRKPSNKLEIFGHKGKILVDQHGIKIFMNEGNDQYGYHIGWNTIYITDIFTPVPFYVRGYEFTRQLYYFVDLILGLREEPICTFKDGANVLQSIHGMFKDNLKN